MNFSLLIMKRYDRRKLILVNLGILFLVVEEVEVFEASKQGQEVPTPEDVPFYHDFTATADKVN